MCKEIIECLTKNYFIDDVVDVAKNEDGANDVFVVSLSNGKKLIYKVFTKDVAPTNSHLSLLEKLGNEFSELPQIIGNKDNIKITSISPTEKSFLMTFQSGVHLDKVQLNQVILERVIKIISNLHKIKDKSLVGEQWYQQALSEIGGSETISKDIGDIDLDKCSRGTIHGDLNHLNILVEDNKLSGIIDWDGMHFDFIVTDLAIFIVHNVLKGDSNISVADVVNGYIKHNKLTEQDIKLLAVFIKLRISQILTLLQGRLKTEVDEKEEIIKHIAIWENKFELLANQK